MKSKVIYKSYKVDINIVTTQIKPYKNNCLSFSLSLAYLFPYSNLYISMQQSD